MKPAMLNMAIFGIKLVLQSWGMLFLPRPSDR
jgi:hypothetical protein